MISPPAIAARVALLLAAALLALAAAACTPIPEQPDVAAAYLDLRRIVEQEQSAEWIVDSVELEDALPQAIRSVCLAPPTAIAGARDFAERELQRLGGDPETAWNNRGRDLDEVDDLLTLHRTRLLIDAAESRRDECPFWLGADDGYRGVHSDAERFLLMFESGGRASVLLGDETSVSGGGSSRIMAGWGIDHRLTLATGFEFGGGGSLPVDRSGGDVRINTVVAIPFLVRVYDMTTFVDFELAPIALVPLEDLDFHPGFRILTGAGVRTLRVRGFQPHVGVYVSWDHYPTDDAPLNDILSIGTRVSFSFDP